MPELPEVQALSDALATRTAGHRIERCELASFSALKTVDPPLEELAGRTCTGSTRRGKYVCLDASGLWLVVHLARAGWIRWSDRLPAGRGAPGRGPLALRVRLSGGAGFDVTEMGTEKRVALWVVRTPDEVPAVAALGVDPLDPAFTAEVLAERLAGVRATVKVALTDQRVLAGVGNAYSDEALHRARLSPFARTATLDDDAVVRLHDALVAVLSEAVDRAAAFEPAELKGDKHRSMQVHGRTGERCPDCGDTVREVSYATSSLQYCPTCQTGGKVLADRRLSRLLK